MSGFAEPAETFRAGPHEDKAPFALVDTGRHGLVIAATDDIAEAQGVRSGQRFTDARAVCPGLVTHPAEPRADAACLDALGHWAMRFSPLVALDGGDGLLLDTTGCAHLFGGEPAMLGDLLARLETMGLTARASIAPTPAAAWALARFATEKSPFVIAGDEDMPASLDPLPASALRLAPDRVLLLNRLGLKTIGHIRAVPRAALERRFRSRDLYRAVMARLDQMTGALGEPHAWLVPPVRFRRSLAFAEPVLDSTGLETALDHLLTGLAADLTRHGHGARVLTFTACHADGRISPRSVRLSRASRAPATIRPLFAGKLDGIDPGFGIDAVFLAAEASEPLADDQASLARTATPASDGDVMVVDRLVNRLGEVRINRRAPHQSHLPERAERPVPPEATASWPAPAPDAPARPFRLLDRPEAITAIAEVPDGPPLRFVWRRVTRQVVRARGPERIAPEWWDDDPGSAGDLDTRDYYEVEDATGHRYWVYREGLYQDPARREAPRWFLHGFFG